MSSGIFENYLSISIFEEVIETFEQNANRKQSLKNEIKNLLCINVGD
jgi:hypothetical protein